MFCDLETTNSIGLRENGQLHFSNIRIRKLSKKGGGVIFRKVSTIRLCICDRQRVWSTMCFMEPLHILII